MFPKMFLLIFYIPSFVKYLNVIQYLPKPSTINTINNHIDIFGYRKVLKAIESKFEQNLREFHRISTESVKSFDDD